MNPTYLQWGLFALAGIVLAGPHVLKALKGFKLPTATPAVTTRTHALECLSAVRTFLGQDFDEDHRAAIESLTVAVVQHREER